MRSLGKDLPHIWTILVEPHKHHLPFHHKTDEQETDFLPPTKEEADSIGLLVRQPTTTEQKQRIGKIMVSESKEAKVEEVDKLLQQNLHPSQKELPSDGYQQHWIHAALSVLQEHHLVEPFDIGEMLTFAKAYADEREQGEAPEAVVYPKLEGHKTGHCKFWISHPMKNQVPSRYKESGGLYGGLM